MKGKLFGGFDSHTLRFHPPKPRGRRRASIGFQRTPSAFVEINMFYCVYILKCKNNRPYIGCTEDLKERIERHQSGYVPATNLKNI